MVDILETHEKKRNTNIQVTVSHLQNSEVEFRIISLAVYLPQLGPKHWLLLPGEGAGAHPELQVLSFVQVGWRPGVSWGVGAAARRFRIFAVCTEFVTAPSLQTPFPRLGGLHRAHLAWSSFQVALDAQFTQTATVQRGGAQQDPGQLLSDTGRCPS